MTRVFEAVRAIALCHNVTPVYEDENNADATEADQHSQQSVSYQASSPDEVGMFVFSSRKAHGIKDS